ncbi:hypothetical protein E3V08_00360 [Candidatus Atribacteria bacterium MT.SAG.1]|nr:hypothetical protein E3V08_00360 [Candidatus Atribacteria bacterium MT.SAG.1]
MYESYEKLIELVNENDTPFFIKNNIDIIYRQIFSKKKHKLSLKKIIATNFLLDYYCIKNRQKKISFSLGNVEECDILFFCYPRRDLINLIDPVAKKIAEKNISIAFLIQRKILPYMDFLPNVKYYVYEDIINFKIVLEAKKKYKYYYLPHLLKWFNKTKIDIFYQRSIKIFFQKYALDKEATFSFLNHIKPKCIYGIHYISNPGCLDAINSLNNKPINVLIQHGFSSLKNKFNDYKGADLVFLWGKYHQQILHDSYDVRLSIVLGNPKLEEALTKIEREKMKARLRKSDMQKILYVSSPLKNQLNKECLDIFINATKDQNFKITYKLHPGESKKDYKYYFKERLISPEQLVLDEDILPIINQSDIMVGSTSTSLYEAMVFMKPVVKVLPPYCKNDWEKLGLPFANNSSDLKRVIFRLRHELKFYKEILSKEADLIQDYFNGIKGSSSRIAEYLVGLLS